MLYYTTSRNQIEGEWATLRKEFDKLEYGHGKEPLTEITRLDLVSWRAQKVAEVKRAVAEMAVAPDGRRVALVTAPANKVASFEGHPRLRSWTHRPGR